MQPDPLLAALLDDVADEARWLIYADWLLDNDREAESQIVRDHQPEMLAALHAGLDFPTALKTVTLKIASADFTQAILANPADDERWWAYATWLAGQHYRNEAFILRNYLDDVRGMVMDGADLHEVLLNIIATEKHELWRSEPPPPNPLALPPVPEFPEEPSGFMTYFQETLRRTTHLLIGLAALAGLLGLLQTLFPLRKPEPPIDTNANSERPRFLGLPDDLFAKQLQLPPTTAWLPDEVRHHTFESHEAPWLTYQFGTESVLVTNDNAPQNQRWEGTWRIERGELIVVLPSAGRTHRWLKLRQYGGNRYDIIGIIRPSTLTRRPN